MFGLMDFLTGGKGRAEIAGKKEAAAQLSFDDVIAAHENWKVRLENIVAGDSSELSELNIEDIRCDYKCALGVWIHAVAIEKFSKDQTFAELVDEHAQFHICAAEVLEQVKRKRLGYSQAIIDGKFTRLSRKVVGLLEMLRSRYGRT